MTELILTNEQFQCLANSQAPIVIRDPTGTAIGVCSFFGAKPSHTSPREPADEDFTEEEIEQALRNRASDAPRYTTAEVLAFLQTLEQSR